MTSFEFHPHDNANNLVGGTALLEVGHLSQYIVSRRITYITVWSGYGESTEVSKMTFASALASSIWLLTEKFLLGSELLCVQNRYHSKERYLGGHDVGLKISFNGLIYAHGPSTP
jgi:hypothetical protein